MVQLTEFTRTAFESKMWNKLKNWWFRRKLHEPDTPEKLDTSPKAIALSERPLSDTMRSGARLTEGHILNARCERDQLSDLPQKTNLVSKPLLKKALSNEVIPAPVVQSLKEGGEVAVQTLLELLKVGSSDFSDSEAANVRENAAKLLGELRATAAVELLEERSLEDTYARVNSAASEAYEKILLENPAKANDRISALIQKVRADRSTPFRGGVFSVLGKINPTPFIEALSDPSEEVRQVAIGALRSAEGAMIKTTLLKALKDASASVRRETIFALRDRGDQDVVEALIEALDDSSELVWEAAAAVLATGNNQKGMAAVSSKLNGRWSAWRTWERVTFLAGPELKILELLIPKMEDARDLHIVSKVLRELGDRPYLAHEIDELKKVVRERESFLRSQNPEMPCFSTLQVKDDALSVEVANALNYLQRWYFTKSFKLSDLPWPQHSFLKKFAAKELPEVFESQRDWDRCEPYKLLANAEVASELLKLNFLYRSGQDQFNLSQKGKYTLIDRLESH